MSNFTINYDDGSQKRFGGDRVRRQLQADDEQTARDAAQRIRQFSDTTNVTIMVNSEREYLPGWALSDLVCGTEQDS